MLNTCDSHSSDKLWLQGVAAGRVKTEAVRCGVHGAARANSFASTRSGGRGSNMLDSGDRNTGTLLGGWGRAALCVGDAWGATSSNGVRLRITKRLYVCSRLGMFTWMRKNLECIRKGKNINYCADIVTTVPSSRKGTTYLTCTYVNTVTSLPYCIPCVMNCIIIHLYFNLRQRKPDLWEYWDSCIVAFYK